MIDLATQTTLITGAIWARPGRNKEDEEVPCTVLFVTNEALSDKLKERYPQQVVFLTRKGDVSSMPIVDFVKGRHYVTMDKIREQLLKASLQDLNDEESDEDLDIEELAANAAEAQGQADEGDGMADLASIFASAGSSPEAAKKMAEGLSKVIEEDGPASINPISLPDSPNSAETAALLNSHFYTYSEKPILGGDMSGDTEHVLRFILSDKLTRLGLRKMFGFEVGQISDLTLSLTGMQPFRIEVNTVIGAFLDSVGPDSFVSIYLSSAGDINEARAGQDLVDRLASSNDANASAVSDAVIIPATNHQVNDNEIIDLLGSEASAAANAATGATPVSNPNQQLNVLVG